nr:helix-turn-helix domain-containing protein [uncultured Actinoplanes sp.]
MADHPGPDDALQLYTADQAAALLQVSPTWLRKKATARQIPSTFVGRHLRFSAADLAAILHAGTRPPTSTTAPLGGTRRP